MDIISFTGVFLLLALLFSLLSRFIVGWCWPAYKPLALIFVVLLVLMLLSNVFGIYFLRVADRDIFLSDVTVNERELLFKDSNVLLSNAEFQLKDIKQEDLPSEIKINTAFARSRIYVPRDLPFIVEAEVVFGVCRMPPGNASSFGKLSYESENYNPNEPHLKIRVAVSLGSVAVLYGR